VDSDHQVINKKSLSTLLNPCVRSESAAGFEVEGLGFGGVGGEKLTIIITLAEVTACLSNEGSGCGLGFGAWGRGFEVLGLGVGGLGNYKVLNLAQQLYRARRVQGLG